MKIPRGSVFYIASFISRATRYERFHKRWLNAICSEYMCYFKDDFKEEVADLEDVERTFDVQALVDFQILLESNLMWGCRSSSFSSMAHALRSLLGRKTVVYDLDSKDGHAELDYFSDGMGVALDVS
eukprot:TRINITY_DN10116_c0_g1_i2.p1 TRINITY_DN10116_c0_g1~~TRINITY_DN10116_c0_g1_i2.p1  ORF type:complete len:144 (-),score=37.50 TRINITY_DN10116_c0_g1_i2:39-419(-)